MNSEMLRSLDLQTLHKFHVCEKHFEKRFINSKTNHLRSGAYPSLFTEDEIVSGLSATNEDTENINPSIDHDYHRKRLHHDHSYPKLCEMLIEWSVLNEHNYYKTENEDDDYSESTLYIGRAGDPTFNEHPVCLPAESETQHTIAATSTLASKDSETIKRDRKGSNEKRMDEVQAFRDDIDAGHRLEDNAVSTEWRDDENLDDIGIIGVIDNTEQPKEASPFSWQKFKEDAVSLDAKQCAGDADEVKFIGEAQLVPDLCDPEDIQIQPEFTCNVCNEPVIGCRYTCVQCRDWDLCGACEARGEHHEHYALRVPPHKTHKETQIVLTALRQLLEGLVLHEEPNMAVIKDEVKTEDPLCDDFPPQAQREQHEDTNNLPQDRLADTGQASEGQQSPGTVDPASSDEEMYEIQYLETESESSITMYEDTYSIIDVPTETAPATRLKRKHLYRRGRHNISPKIQKQCDQGFEFYYEENTNKATQAETNYVMETPTNIYNLMAPHTQMDDLIVLDDGSNIVLPPNSIVIECPNEKESTEKDDLIFLDDGSNIVLPPNSIVIECPNKMAPYTQMDDLIVLDDGSNKMAPHTQKDDLIVLDDGSNIVLPPNSVVIECPNEMPVTQMLELSSLAFNADAGETQYMTLDGQLLEVIDCSRELCVNMKRLSEDDIRAATGLRRGKR